MTNKSNKCTNFKDGFPRNVAQAEKLQEISPPTKVVNLEMREIDLVTKLLGRRICTKKGCGNSYNVAHAFDPNIGVDMPPLLPKSGDHHLCDCGAKLGKRDDDVEDVIRNRLEVYKQETFPLVEHFKTLNLLHIFEIKKGLADFPKLLQIVAEE